MNHHTLFRPLLLAAAVAAITGTAIAAPQASSTDAHPPEHSHHAKIDVNGDGVIDRTEAAAYRAWRPSSTSSTRIATARSTRPSAPTRDGMAGAAMASSR